MEKNQHTHEEGKAQQAKTGIAHQSPDQHPTETGKDHNRQQDVALKEERHSETSLPQNDNETLGTP